jgi:hypothetical protein
LKRLTRCGCKPCAAQIRWTERNEMPAAAAIARPVQWGRLARRLGERQVDHPLDHRPGQGQLPRRTALILQQPVHALCQEPFLPAPHRRLGAAHLAHDRKRAHAVGAQQHDPRPFDMLLAAVAIRHDRLEPSTIIGGNLDFDPLRIPARYHILALNGILMTSLN